MVIRKTPTQIRSKFHDLIKETAQNNHAFVRNPGKDFSRHRICTFKDTVLNLLTMETHSLNRELANYYGLQGRQAPTRSAFVQARQKLLPDTFLYLLRELNTLFPLKKKYKGLHILGCDGTDSNIPADKNDLSSFIPYNSNNGGYYQFHTVVMYDLLEKRYIDAVIQPRREMKESSACCCMVDRTPVQGKCLFIADRGFMSFNLLAHIQEKNHFYLFRIKDPTSDKSPFKSFSPLLVDDADAVRSFVISRKRTCPPDTDNVAFKSLRSSISFDFIPPNDKRSSYSLSFRLVRLTIGSSFEYLITNLPADSFPLLELKELYQLRWRIETSFLFLKYGIAMNSFHCINRVSILQEIFARLLLSNFISLVVSCVKLPFSGSKYFYNVSVSDAIYICRRFLLLRSSNKVILAQLLKNTTPIRPGRSSPRNMRSQVLVSLQNRS